MTSLLPWLALGTVSYLVFDRMKGPPSRGEALPGAPVPLTADVRYLFLIRLEATEAEARPVLESKGVENLTFSTASVPPFWTQPGERFGTTIASFMATPRGSSMIELGTPFYGVGRLEKLIRLDGHPLTDPAPSV